MKDFKYNYYNNDTAFVVIGLILSVLTFGLVFVLFYSYFFEHESWLNIRNLKKYINTYGLPEPTNPSGETYYCDVGTVYIIYCGDIDGFSIHNGVGCVVSNSKFDPFYNRNYDWINKAIKNNIK